MGWYLFQHQEQWRGIAIERPSLVGVCGAACVGSLLVAGPIFQLMTRQVGTDVGLFESTNLAIMTSAINTFVPLHGGLVARGVYLKKRHGLELSKFAATFIGYSILRLCAAATLACAAGVWLLARQADGVGLASIAHGERSTVGLQWLVAVAGAMAAAAFGACLVRPSWFQGLGFDSRQLPGWLRPVMTLHDGWQELVKCPTFMLKVLVLVVLQIAAEVVGIWAAWNAVGASLSPVASLLVASFGILTSLTGLTPGGIGLVDLVSVAVGATVAIEPAHGIAASLVARGVGLVILAITGPLAFYWLARQLRRR